MSYAWSCWTETLSTGVKWTGCITSTRVARCCIAFRKYLLRVPFILLRVMSVNFQRSYKRASARCCFWFSAIFYWLPNKQVVRHNTGDRTHLLKSSASAELTFKGERQLCGIYHTVILIYYQARRQFTPSIKLHKIGFTGAVHPLYYQQIEPPSTQSSF